MSEGPYRKPESLQDQAPIADETVLVATVAGTVLDAFFDELEKTEDLKEKGGRLRSLIMGDGVMAEPAIRAVLFPDMT